MRSDIQIVAFGDEIGFELLCRKLDPEKTVFIYDPKRPKVLEWIEKFPHKDFNFRAYPERDDMENFIQELSGSKAEFGIIFSFGRILPENLLAVFKNGIVNFHGGRLPEYRGANVLQWAIINGESETAMTLHYAAAKPDAGAVIDSQKVNIDDDDDAVSVRKKLFSAAEGLIDKWLPEMIKGKVEAKQQDESRIRLWPRRKPQDGLIDWTKPEREIFNLIRALVSPWPGAFYYDKNAEKRIIDRMLSIDEIKTMKKNYTGS